MRSVIVSVRGGSVGVGVGVGVGVVVGVDFKKWGKEENLKQKYQPSNRKIDSFRGTAIN